jgi:hypothetical protein
MTGPACLMRDRDRDASAPYRKLDERPLGLGGKVDVEGNVLRHVRGPLVVALCEGLVPAHRPMLRPARSRSVECRRRAHLSDDSLPCTSVRQCRYPRLAWGTSRSLASVGVPTLNEIPDFTVFLTGCR